GSLASGRLGAPARALPRAVCAAVAASLLYAYGFAAVTVLFFAVPLAAMVVVGAVPLAPIGLVLGMCYPLGIAIVAARNAGLVPWAWGLNGATSVVATVLAVFIGSRLGFTATLLTGTLAYTVALVAMGTALRFDAARRLTEAPVRRPAAVRPGRHVDDRQQLRGVPRARAAVHACRRRRVPRALHRRLGHVRVQRRPGRHLPAAARAAPPRASSGPADRGGERRCVGVVMAPGAAVLRGPRGRAAPERGGRGARHQRPVLARQEHRRR